MTTTNNLGITLLEQAQSQKEVTVNEALTILDAAMGGGIIDKDLATPPGSPTEGDRYIVASSPTGAWTGHAKHIAYYFNAGWRFLVPGEGLFVWVNDEDILYVFDGTNWTAAPGGAFSPSMLGINTTADSTNRLAVRSNAALFTAIYAADSGNGDIQHKLNKEAAGDTASFLFQTNFSGRAEIGLTGDDNFHFKVSPDGSTWVDALVIDKTTGLITHVDGTIPRTLSVQNGGNTNNSSSGSGSDFDHNLTFTLPANFLVSGRALRVTAHFKISTGSATPTLIHKLKLGSVTGAEHPAVTPQVSISNDQYALSWIIQATSAPGASASVEVAPLHIVNAPANSTRNSVDMPITVATNATVQIKISTLWATAGTGTNTIALDQFIVEALN